MIGGIGRPAWERWQAGLKAPFRLIDDLPPLRMLLVLVLDNLSKQGLIERVRDTADRRCVYVHLTERGRDLITTIFPAHVQRVLTTMSALTPEEQQQLALLCRKLGLAQG